MVRTLFCVVLFAHAFIMPAQNPPKKQEAPKKKAETASPPAAPRARIATNVKSFELTPPSKTVAVAGVMGASRGAAAGPAAVPLAPRLARVYALPRLQWQANGGLRQFSVSITDEDGEEVFHDAAKGTEFQYPGSAPALKPGATYYWTVEAEPASSMTAPSEPAGFVVVSGEERSEIEGALKAAAGDSLEARLARAHALRDAGLWYDTVAAYGDLIQAHPADARLYRERADVLGQIPATAALANADREQAKKLEQK